MTPPGRPLLVVNALALRPGGDAARTFLENVLRELPAAWEGDVAALVRGGVDLSLEGVRFVGVPGIASGAARVRAEWTSLPRLIRDLGPDVFLNPNESVPRSVAAPLVVVAQNLLFHCAGAGPLRAGPPVARLESRLQFSYYRRRMPHAYRRARVVACVSEHARAVLSARAGLDPRRTRIVACGADRLPIRARTVGSRMLLVVGAIAEYKRLDVAVRALSELSDDYRLVVAGEEWPGAWGPLQELAGRLGVADRVVRAGVVGDEALADLYAEAHALVTTSACESFGIPAAEAMRAGLPVVAADEPWARELGRDAIVLARPEAGAVAAAVRTLEDEAEWRRRSLAGAEVASGYTWRGTAAGLAAAAREALAA